MKDIKSLPIIRLPESNSSKPGLFIVNEEKFYQIQSIQSKSQSQSWFLKSNSIGDSLNSIKDQVISKNAGRILLVIPIDPIFVILNLFLQSFDINSSMNQNYEELEELIEKLLSAWKFSKDEPDQEETKPTISDLNIFQTFLTQNLSNIRKVTEVLVLDVEEGEGEKGKELYRFSVKKVKELLKGLVEKISISSESNDQVSFWNEILLENGWKEVYETNEDLKPKINQMIALRILESYVPTSLYKDLQKDYNFQEIETLIKSKNESKQETLNPNFTEFIGLKSNSTTSKSKSNSTTNPKKKKITSNENQPKVSGMKSLSSFWKPSSSSSKDTSKKQDESSK